MRTPSIQHADSMKAYNSQAEINGKWVLARPEPFHSWRERWKLAWAVFTGKADALFWHGQ